MYFMFLFGVDTKLQIADVLTKPLAEDTHLFLSSLLLGGPVLFADSEHSRRLFSLSG